MGKMILIRPHVVGITTGHISAVEMLSRLYLKLMTSYNCSVIIQ